MCRSQAQRLTADYFRFVTRRSGTGQQQWLGDVQVSLALFNWAHLYQCLRRCVSDDLYRSASTVELIEAMPHGTTLHLRPGGSLDFDLVVCADGYHSMGRRLIDPGATPHYRGMVLWRGSCTRATSAWMPSMAISSESDTRGTGSWATSRIRAEHRAGRKPSHVGYYLQFPEDALSSMLVDDQERQQSGSVPFREGASGGQGEPDRSNRQRQRERKGECQPDRQFESDRHPESRCHHYALARSRVQLRFQCQRGNQAEGGHAESDS